MKPSRSILALALASACSLSAQEETKEPALVSGPAVGTDLTPVTCYATDGARAGKEFDAAALLVEGPGALLFIHELTRNTAPVIRGLDNLATEFSILGFKSTTIMLSGDRTAGESQLKRVNGSLRLANPLVLSVDGAEGPGNYALNRKCTLTLVLAKDGKVQRTMALVDTGPNDVPEIRSAIEEVAGKVPDDEAALRTLVAASLPSDPEALKELAAGQAIELRKLREQLTALRQQPRGPGMNPQPAQRPMRGGPAPTGRQPQARENPGGAAVQREGKPPEDPQLNTLLRSYIRKTNDDARVDEVYAEIVARAAESAELKTEAVEMFKLMLSISYGTEHAQGLAKEFLKEQAAPKKDE